MALLALSYENKREISSMYYIEWIIYLYSMYFSQ